jgi:hypothetical protein
MSTQPTAFTSAQTAVQAKIAARQVMRRAFNDLCQQASRLLQQADQLAIVGGLSDIEIRQARAASKIAGINFYSIAGQADAADFNRLDYDLRHVARSVDPLIEAIGADAKANSTVLDDATFKDCFKDVIETAILGNACHVLDTCANAAREAIEDKDEQAEHRRTLQEAE